MAQNNTLRESIRSAIKENGNNEITGALVQQVLLSMVNSLGFGYMYRGMATPATNPGTPDQNVFYFATEAGTYSNFGGIVLSGKELAILCWDGTWHYDTISIASQSGPFIPGDGTNSAKLAGAEADATGDNSVCEGKYTRTPGECSHAEGRGTVATNYAEHAEGMYNISHKASGIYGNAGNTQHSVGIGTVTDRKNALEIMQNGDIYVIGLGGYDGTNPGAAGVQTLQQLLGGVIEIDIDATTLTEDKLLALRATTNPASIVIVSGTIRISAFTTNNTDTMSRIIFIRQTGKGIQVTTWTIDLQGNITKTARILLYN